MNILDSKPWYQSKTIWTQIIGVVATVLTAGGVQVLNAPGVQDLIVTGVTALATIVFRVTSQPTTIKGTPVAAANTPVA